MSYNGLFETMVYYAGIKVLLFYRWTSLIMCLSNWSTEIGKFSLGTFLAVTCWWEYSTASECQIGSYSLGILLQISVRSTYNVFCKLRFCSLTPYYLRCIICFADHNLNSLNLKTGNVCLSAKWSDQ